MLAAEQGFSVESDSTRAPEGSQLDPRACNSPTMIPEGIWDPMIDYAGMSRNVRGFKVSLLLGE